MARDNQVIDNAFVNEFEKIYPKVSTIFPIEKPSLLHGDLWSGNYIIGESSTPYLVDIANIYPLMVHVNLFGSNYAQRVKTVIKRLI